MEPIRNAQGAAIQHFIESMPATSHLGIEVVSIGDGRCVLDLPCARDITVDGRIVQGGIVAVVADYAAVAAAGSTLGEGWSVATLSCETHNLLPAQGEKLVAVGEIIKGSTRHLVAKADVHLDTIDGAVCLTGLFTARALEVDLPGGVGKQPLPRSAWTPFD